MGEGGEGREEVELVGADERGRRKEGGEGEGHLPPQRRRRMRVEGEPAGVCGRPG